MAGADRQPGLFGDSTQDHGTVQINDRAVLRTADGYRGSLGPAFYGLPTTLVALLLMALSPDQAPRRS